MNVPGYADTAAQHGIDAARGLDPAGPLERWLRPREVQDFDRWAARKLLELSGGPALRLLLWNGESVTCPGRAPVADLHIADRAALMRLLVRPDMELGELYTASRVEVEGDLPTALTAIASSLPARGDKPLPRRLLHKLQLLKRNTLRRSQDNVHHHYDVSNDFYRLWLDERMLYTCAYYAQPEFTLEQAQAAKMDHIARKLELEPGMRVLEVGCGWGGLALHFARHYGVSVSAYNISKEQLKFARQRAGEEGLADQIDFIEADYRTATGSFDRFVSVGMLEHVGPPQYGELGSVVQRCLEPDGLGLIHSIGRNRPAPLNAWIDRRIFPGAYPPSLSQMSAIFDPHSLSVLDVENLRLHYAKTLRHWLDRFDASRGAVAELFDETFVRLWRFYLSGSIAAFLSGELQLFQVLFNHTRSNALSMTRKHMYRR